MARKFTELEARMTSDRRARIKAQASEAMAEMLLAEIRKQVGLTQTDLADALGIKQPTLSRLETQGDMQISTLRRIIAALGGQLELVAHLPTGTVRLTQFDEELHAAAH
jgi:transcriptional regulator with XRE-family HTH domain